MSDHPPEIPFPALRRRRRVGCGPAALPVEVEVSVACDAWRCLCPAPEQLIEKAARAALAASPPPYPLLAMAVILTDDAEQRRLNSAYRGHDAPTNVLSFAIADPGAPLPVGAPVLLGDVVLAYETVAREAGEQQKPLADHLQHLVVHGVLHLLGFDHQNDTEAAIMEGHEIAILASLGVPDPYRDIM